MVPKVSCILGSSKRKCLNRRTLRKERKNGGEDGVLADGRVGVVINERTWVMMEFEVINKVSELCR